MLNEVGRLAQVSFWESFLKEAKAENDRLSYLPEIWPQRPWTLIWIGKYAILASLSIFPFWILASESNWVWLFLPLVFYGLEVPLVFIFPALLDSGCSANVFKKSFVAAWKMGYLNLFVQILPLAARMVIGLLDFRKPGKAWLEGSKKVFVWYGENRLANRI